MLNENTPFIKYLINKRQNNTIIEKNLHIAALVPSTLKNRQCFL